MNKRKYIKNSNNICKCCNGYQNKNTNTGYFGLYPVLSTPVKVLYVYYNNAISKRYNNIYDG